MCDYNNQEQNQQKHPLGEPKGKSPEKDSEINHVKRVADLVSRFCEIIINAKTYGITDQEVKTAVKIVTDKAL